MNLRQRWRGFRRGRRRKRAARESRGEPLREFVYLDEVSVFSLLASRIGPLATEFTDSESSSLQAETHIRAGIATPVASLGSSGSITSTDASNSQVLRKSTVQSTFKELLSYVQGSLVLLPAASDEDLETGEAGADKIISIGRCRSWAADETELQRGAVLEVDVALDADETFQLVTIAATLLELLDEMPQMPPGLDAEALMNTVAGMRIIGKMLAGLVPVRGKLVDYTWVEIAGRDVVVHKSKVDQLWPPPRCQGPVYVVGLAEGESFWKDLRRVLFAGSRFRVLCRIERSGLQRSWTPVKLMDVLHGVAPDLESAFHAVPDLVEQLRRGRSTEPEPQSRMREALLLHAQFVCQQYGHTLSVREIEAFGLPSIAQCQAFATVESRRDAFKALISDLAERLGFEANPEVLSHERVRAWLETQPEGEDDAVALSARSGDPDARFLDCEVIAVYW